MAESIMDLPLSPASPARPIPTVGFHYDIPAAEYFAWDAVNCSALKKMADCAANYDHDVRNPREATPAMLQGSLAHAMILEPAKVKERYLVADECSGITGKGAACTNNGKILSGGRWYCGVHGKRLSPDEMPKALTEDGELIEQAVVTADMMANAQAMKISVDRNRAARKLLETCRMEVCIVWMDPETKLLCKARLDAYDVEARKISDVKTCECSSPAEFSKAIATHNYDMQGAFYTDGASIASEGVLHDEFYFIAVAKTEARVCAVYKAHKGMMDLGRYRYRRMLADFKWCRENNCWPGYHDHQVEPINVPRWFFEQESKK